MESQLAYVVLFGLTTAVCLGCLTRLGQIEDDDTRRGLGALLALSALWAATQVGHVLAPTSRTASAVYTFGLVVGLATVGAWLYFCSAYAGRSYHRKSRYRRLAVGVYVLIVGFKLTNPWHGLYFETTTIREPFRYIVIHEQPAFWVVAGLAYVLSALGFSLLVDVFDDARLASRGPVVVVALAALPVVFDVAGYLAPPPVLELNYEPVGVGLFALGALYVVREPFFAVSRYGRVQLVDAMDDPVLVLDADGRVWDFNDAALERFPRLAERDSPEIPDVADALDATVLSDGGTVGLDRGGETRYFVVKTTPVTVGATAVGRVVVLTDVTEIERQRARLQWKDEQFEGFATAISHELNNSVGIVSGQAELLSRLAAETDDLEIQSRVETISEEVADMKGIVEQLRTLARYSQTVPERTHVDLADAARAAQRQSDSDDLDVDVEAPFEVEAEAERLRELFKQAYTFAGQLGASEVVVRGHDEGFDIVHDGRSLAQFDEDAVFSYGNAVPDSDAAMAPPNLRTLATTQGWKIELIDGSTIRVRTEERGALVG
ncbi:MAG: histidine kinase N-terminal 7TM domain-containing protein [Halobacteriales archaeon]